MGSIAFQVTQTGQTTHNRSVNVADADITRIITAYQPGANTNVNGTATRTQVLNFWISTMMQGSKAFVQSSEQAAQIAALPPILPIEAT
jgi:hypothetical protein